METNSQDKRPQTDQKGNEKTVRRKEKTTDTTVPQLQVATFFSGFFRYSLQSCSYLPPDSAERQNHPAIKGQER
jgi:hypothetical protein